LRFHKERTTIVSLNDEPLQLDTIQKALGRSLFAGNFVYRESVDSTNTVARALADQGSPEGTVVAAEEQTSGRGRLGRGWVSPPGANLLFSLLLRPSLEPENVFILTMILALASIDAIKELTHLNCLIKWPNDLYLKRKKLAGILTEFSVRGKSVEHVILGLGLNVHWHPDSGTNVARQATSLFRETGLKTDRSELLVRIIKAFEDYYGHVKQGKNDSYYKRWNKLCLVLGKQVVIESSQGEIHGVALEIDRQGALMIRDHKGTEQRITSGDVSVKWDEVGSC
jgi:BirA family biotin operon repressor/biotin-[acetyl-CoA-carboxylase] ligase